MKFHECRSLCWFLSLLLALQPILVLQQQLAAQEPEKPAVKEPTPEELAKIADELEKGFKALEAAAKEIPRDTFDPQAIVDKVGQDPVKLFEWVRDNTYWVPYQGALRGPTGVLMDRLGSSLDRSLLLAELLRVAGHDMRLVRAELGEEQANALLPRLRPVPKEPLPKPAPANKNGIESRLDKHAKDSNFDAAALRMNKEKVLLQAAKLAEAVVQRVAEQTPMILNAIGRPDEKTVESESNREAAAELVALRDHWYVQLKAGNAWTSLDPLLPDATTGSAQAMPKESLVPDAKTGKIQLDGKYCHELEIRVVIEQWTKDGLKEKTVLKHTLRPFELFGKRIALQHVPLHWPKDLNPFSEKDPLQQVKTHMLAETEWLPVLNVGAERIVQSSFSDSGEVNMAAANQLASSLEKGIKGLDPFGRSPGPGAKPKMEGHLTAEWIEYKTEGPGLPSRTIRRSVFDALGPAARSTEKINSPELTGKKRLDRALSLCAESEILVQACLLSPSFMELLATDNLLINKTRLLTLLRNSDSTDQTKLFGEASALVRFSTHLYLFALGRFAWSRHRTDIYMDRLNVVCFEQQLQESQSGELLIRSGFDIVANEIGVHRRPGIDRFGVRLEQGVLDTNAEAFLTSRDAKVENTAEIFSQSISAGDEWLTVRSLRDPTWSRVALPPDVQSRVKEDISSGCIVMVPKEPISKLAGWWRIDPRTGDLIGKMQSGKGQGAMEKVIVVASLSLAMIAAFYSFGGCVGKEGTHDSNAVSPGKYGLCFVCALITLVATFVGCWLLFSGIETGGAAIAFALDFGVNVGCNMVDYHLK